MMRIIWTPAPKLEMSEEQLRTLQAWVASSDTPQKVVLRSRIVLLAHEGTANNAIARRLETSRPTVILWRERFAQAGPQALLTEAPGRGCKRRILEDRVQAVVHATLHTKPANATDWTVRAMAKARGVSRSTVQRIWDAHGLRPDYTPTVELSRHQRFVKKFQEVVGLYLNPPQKALVLCLDEKSAPPGSQTPWPGRQAPQCSQSGVTMKQGRCGTMTHYYKPRGTIRLFAALNALERTVIGDCAPRRRHQQFLEFLQLIDWETPPGLDLHVILDNYATHDHERLSPWVKRHPGFHLHFTPAGCSWLNLIVCWFSKLTGQRLRRGVFRTMPELIAAIRYYLERTDEQPTPFVWYASAEQILANVTAAKLF